MGQWRSRVRQRAFSFVELLVAIAIAAAVIGGAVLAYQAIGRSTNRLGNFSTVQLPAGVMENFYGTDVNYVQAYFAPNYSRSADAEALRDKLYEDLDYASAVFCLARTDRSTIRPVAIPVPAPFDLRALDTPEAFREFLANAIPESESVFESYRGSPTATNLSIFILMPSDSSSELTVRAVYELDFIPTSNPAGTYASVRRYQGNTCTDFYDIFYPAADLPEINRAFSPVVACFERESRLNVTEGSTYDRFKVAANRPFYFVWWPDPTALTLEAMAPAYTPNNSVRDLYAGMGNRTAFFLVLPMFPAL